MSIGSVPATACSDIVTIPIAGSSWLATKGPTSLLVPWQRSTGQPGLSPQAGDEEDPMRYTVIYEEGDTSWGAYVPDLPGCTAVGSSRSEVEQLIVEAIAAYLEDLRDAGQPIPLPRSASGLVEVA